MAIIGPGNIINERFLMIGLLGDGGFGFTFHAFDLEKRTNVVVKILKNATPSPEEEEQFIFEEQCVREAKSPYIVKSLGYYPPVGPNAAGLICFEYLNGAKDLRRSASMLMDESDFPNAYKLYCLVTYLAQCADGLGVLHSKGIIHRDVKPENLIVDFENHAKVIDFGLAIDRSAEAAKIRYGTPSMIAPEIGQLPASFRSDVYALGVTMFRVLADEFPLLNLPIKLSRFLALRFDEIEPAIFDELDSIFSVATALDPNERYSSASQMARALWAVSAKLRPLAIAGQTGQDKIPAIEGGQVGSLGSLLAALPKVVSKAEGKRNPFHRLDGLLIEPERKYAVSNRLPAFIFEFKEMLYQINSDTLRKAMYRLMDNAEQVRKKGGDVERLLIPVKTKDGVRALRLASNLPDGNGNIPANGFYCYSCEDMERMEAFG